MLPRLVPGRCLAGAASRGGRPRATLGRPCAPRRRVPPRLVPGRWRAGATSRGARPRATLGRPRAPPWRSAREAGPGYFGRPGKRHGFWRTRTWPRRLRHGPRGQAVRWRPGRPGSGTGARRWPRRMAGPGSAQAAGAVGLVAHCRPLLLRAGCRGHAQGWSGAARRLLPGRRGTRAQASCGRHVAVRGVRRRRSRR